jgi:hypothetical protein
LQQSLGWDRGQAVNIDGNWLASIEEGLCDPIGY